VPDENKEDAKQIAFARRIQVEIVVRLLGPHDLAMLDAVAPEVFDHPIDPRWAAEFLGDPRHHLEVAMTEGRVVGMASAMHYIHPSATRRRLGRFRISSRSPASKAGGWRPTNRTMGWVFASS
jgi:hypothetical protein